MGGREVLATSGCGRQEKPALSSKQEATDLRAEFPGSMRETFQNTVTLQVFFSDHGKPECINLWWEF